MPFGARRPPDQSGRQRGAGTGDRRGADVVVPLGAITPRITLTGHGEPVEQVTIAPDGTWLATASWHTARIWNSDGTLRATLTGHDGPVEGLAIAPDGTWLAATSADDTVPIWAADGTLRAPSPAITAR